MKFGQSRSCCWSLFFFVLTNLVIAQSLDADSNASGSTPKAKAPKATRVVPPEKAAPIYIPRFAAVPVIDGNLSDEVWKKAAVFKDFLQTQPGENIVAHRINSRAFCLCAVA